MSSEDRAGLVGGAQVDAQDAVFAAKISTVPTARPLARSTMARRTYSPAAYSRSQNEMQSCISASVVLVEILVQESAFITATAPDRSSRPADPHSVVLAHQAQRKCAVS
jgi:hypothetical protein